jgi:hypothetical protein
MKDKRKRESKTERKKDRKKERRNGITSLPPKPLLSPKP